ncbi:MAG: Hsp20/alpha crystallin family protein [Rickettsiales bacterium]|nr:Hsp20/alpha crystallin family protein [Rickettsiales bacterium]
MDTKGSTFRGFTRSSVALLISMCLLVFICCLLIIQNRKLETALLTSAGHGRRCIGYGDGPRVFGRMFDRDFMDYRFEEFEREMNALKNRVNSMLNGDAPFRSIDYREESQFEGENTTTSNRHGEEDVEDSSKKSKDKKDRSGENRQPAGASHLLMGKLKMRGGGDHMFDLTTNYRKENGDYEVEITVPKDFTANDINVSLRNSMLTIRAKKEIDSKVKGGKVFSSHNSFYQSFSIPRTKAVTKDIGREMIGGKLRLSIPIIDDGNKGKVKD